MIKLLKVKLIFAVNDQGEMAATNSAKCCTVKVRLSGVGFAKREAHFCFSLADDVNICVAQRSDESLLSFFLRQHEVARLLAVRLCYLNARVIRIGG